MNRANDAGAGPRSAGAALPVLVVGWFPAADDPIAGRYGVAIMRVVRIAAAATALALGAFIVIMVRVERRRTARGSTRSPRTWTAPREIRTCCCGTGACG